MARHSFSKRTFVTAALLVAGTVLLHTASHGERVPPHRPLGDLPRELASWKGKDFALERRIVEAAGVDDYVNRIYQDREGHSVGLYVGYYSSQRTGDTIHSPKNCLPGAGWRPIRAARLGIDVPGSSRITVNEYSNEKGLERDLVLYWYQGRGRVEANEYWGKVWLVVDALTRNRTDGCLVRLFTSMEDGEDKARARAIDLGKALCPRLCEILPE